MTDINSRPPAGPPESKTAGKAPDTKDMAAADGFRDDDLRRDMELLFYAYRDFIAEPDAILADFGFGRAHHRVIHFVGRNPDIAVAELLDILKITKQSLSRVLGQLVREGFILQRQGKRDRRQRLLTLTAKGKRLEQRLSSDQRERLARAFAAAGAGGVEGFRRVLAEMINEHDRRRRGLD